MLVINDSKISFMAHALQPTTGTARLLEKRVEIRFKDDNTGKTSLKMNENVARRLVSADSANLCELKRKTIGPRAANCFSRYRPTICAV